MGTGTDTWTPNPFIQMFVFQWGKEPSTSFFWLLSYGHFSHQISLCLKGTSISIYPNPLLGAGLILAGFSRLGAVLNTSQAGESATAGANLVLLVKGFSIPKYGAFHVPACASCLSSHGCAPPKSLTAFSLYHPIRGL